MVLDLFFLQELCSDCWLAARDGLREPSPRQGHYQHKVFPFAHRTWSQTTAYISTSDQLLQQWINGSQHNIIVAS